MRAVTWIKDKILHAYYMSSLDDRYEVMHRFFIVSQFNPIPKYNRILVERLLNGCLVPFQLPSEDRMIKLLYLYGTIDEHASRAFVEIQKTLLL